jgi:hypothetical protein
VDSLDLWVFEQFANTHVRLSGLGEDRIGHDPLGVEAAERQHAVVEHRRDLVDEFGGLVRAFGDEDRMTRAIGAYDIVADVVEQENALANGR